MGLNWAGTAVCQIQLWSHDSSSMKTQITKDHINIRHRMAVYSLIVLASFLPSSCSPSSVSQEELFDKAVSAGLEQETLKSDSSGTARGYDFEIFVTNTHDTQPTKLTDNSAADWFPSLSPDGAKIAFDSDRDGKHEIYVMNIDGTNQLNITNHPGDDSGPVWSPDGSQIAFISRRDGNYEIFVMDLDGANQTNLTNSSANEYQVDWSPDGSRLAFYSDRDDEQNTEIYVMDIDGSNISRLTNNKADEFDPNWSPDGTKIVFTSERNGNKEIYLMNDDGSGQINLTNNMADDFNPIWTLDGEFIIFASLRNLSLFDNFRSNQHRSFVMNVDGSNQRVISDYSGNWISDLCCTE